MRLVTGARRQSRPFWLLAALAVANFVNGVLDLHWVATGDGDWWSVAGALLCFAVAGICTRCAWRLRR